MSNTSINLRRSRRILSGFIAIFTALTTWALLDLSQRSYRDRVAHLKEEMRDAGITLAGQVSDFFGNARRFSLTANRIIKVSAAADPREDLAFQAVASTFSELGSGVFNLHFISPQGRLISLEPRNAELGIDVRDREYFKAAEGTPEETLYIGSPIVRRRDGRWGIPFATQLSRKTSDAALLLIDLDSATLMESLAKYIPDTARGFRLLRSDGTIIATYPADESQYGRKDLAAVLPCFPNLDSPTTKALAYTQIASLGGKPSIVACAAVPGFNFAIEAQSWPIETAYGGNRFTMLAYTAGLISLVLIWILGWRLWASFREIELGRRALEESRNALLLSDTAKDRLFQIIAHDLKGPIGALTHLLGSLRQERASLSQASVDEIITESEKASLRVHELLSELLDWAKTQKEGLRMVEPRSCAISELLDAELDYLAAVRREKKLLVRREGDEEISALADPRMLKTIFRNVLGNAAKFSPKGGTITIRSSSSVAGDTAVVLISIEDQGVGIDVERLAEIQAHRPVKPLGGTAGERGTGIGLALCSELMEAQGGSLCVEGRAEGGTRVSLKLPSAR